MILTVILFRAFMLSKLNMKLKRQYKTIHKTDTSEFSLTL